MDGLQGLVKPPVSKLVGGRGRRWGMPLWESSPSGLRVLRESVSAPRASGLHAGFQAVKAAPARSRRARLSCTVLSTCWLRMRARRKLYRPSPGRISHLEAECLSAASGALTILPDLRKMRLNSM